MVENLDRLIKEFGEVCEAWDGEVTTSLGKRYCLIPRKEFNPILLALDTTSPSVSVSTGMSHVDLFSIKNIERNKHSFMLISKNGDIINIRPDTGVITFNGDVKGSIWSCKIER
ncbi:MAG: hypothetical protein DRM98_00110 [Thermoplasmata archaeon]|nr:MAG: hypothetical protein DRM98_00110 [Thermoplasmata archaeon]